MSNKELTKQWEDALHGGLKRRRLAQNATMPYIFERDILVSPNDQEAWSEFYIAHVTHPDKPNYTENSRGRTTHYALTNKEGDKSLCNMIVTTIHREMIDLRVDRQFSGTGSKAGCRVCTQKATQLIKEWKQA